MSDLTTEVIGYRQWHVTPDLKLRAAHKADQVWASGENVAVCKPNDRLVYMDDGFDYKYVPRDPCKIAPGSNCECGWYALHDPSDFWYGKKSISTAYQQLLATPGNSDPLVSGVIAAWGNIEVHHQGFRAQYARVVALVLPESKRDQTVVRACAAEYGVPVVKAERLTQIAGEYGSPVPVEMRPEKVEKPPLEVGFTQTFNLTAKQYRQWANKYKSAPSRPSHRYFSYGQVAPAAPSYLWTPERDNKAKPLARRRPKYDPRWFTAKRNGGLA